MGTNTDSLPYQFDTNDIQSMRVYGKVNKLVTDQNLEELTKYYSKLTVSKKFDNKLGN